MGFPFRTVHVILLTARHLHTELPMPVTTSDNPTPRPYPNPCPRRAAHGNHYLWRCGLGGGRTHPCGGGCVCDCTGAVHCGTRFRRWTGLTLCFASNGTACAHGCQPAAVGTLVCPWME